MQLSKGSMGFLVVLLVAGLAGGYALLNSGLFGTDAPSGPVTIEIVEGTGAGAVGDLLEERGVIPSATAFSVRARFDERADDIRPGTYELTPGMDTDEILAVLTAAPPSAPAFTVTIPEGLNVGQTLERIATAEGSPFTVEQLTAALTALPVPAYVPVTELPDPQPYPALTPYEGLLFPDTYEFRQDATPEQVLQRLLDRTTEVLDSVGVPEPDRYRALVVASLIEREARLAAEQPVISGVIANRLAEPQRLQVDATVLYANASTANVVTNAMLELDSPWNTYTTDGLPPTPISGAGRTAIEAAVGPQPNDFLYYVVNTCEGAHAFGRTLQEHNANVAKFRSLECGG